MLICYVNMGYKLAGNPHDTRQVSIKSHSEQLTAEILLPKSLCGVFVCICTPSAFYHMAKQHSTGVSIQTQCPHSCPDTANTSIFCCKATL